MSKIQMVLFLRVERLVEWRTRKLIDGSIQARRSCKLGGPHIGFDQPGLDQFVEIDMNEPEYGFPEILKPNETFNPRADGIMLNTTLNQLSVIVHNKCKQNLLNVPSYEKLLRPIVRRELKALIGRFAHPPVASQAVNLGDDIGKYLPLTKQRVDLSHGINLHLYKFLLASYDKHEVEGTGFSIADRIIMIATAV